MLTPYQFASNTPIMAIDLDGLERFIVIAEQVDNVNGTKIEKASADFIVYTTHRQVLLMNK